MLEVLGARQQQLLRLLLKNKQGLPIEALSAQLEITRTAVRQHLSALISAGFVSPSVSRPSGGRPEQLYVLSELGKELFPRGYAWFAELVVNSVKAEDGPEQFSERLRAIGAGVGKQLRVQQLESSPLEQNVEKLSDIMQQLGYDTTQAGKPTEAAVIEASNCIFHNLAIKDPDICQFDLALMSAFTNSQVDHQACMAKGANVCRFKFTAPE